MTNQNTTSNSASDFYKDLQERTNKRLSEIISSNTPTDLKAVDDLFGKSSVLSKTLKGVPAVITGVDTIKGINENIKSGSNTKETVADAITNIGFDAGEALASSAIGAAVGGLPGVAVALLAGLLANDLTNNKKYNGKTLREWIDYLV